MITFIRQRTGSFKFALQGIADIARTQGNFRVHLAATALVISLGAGLRIPSSEWAILTLSMALVMATEAVNTAIEHLTDLVSPERQILAGRAKDAAAGAVLIAALGATFIGALVFYPRLLALLSAWNTPAT